MASGNSGLALLMLVLLAVLGFAAVWTVLRGQGGPERETGEGAPRETARAAGNAPAASHTPSPAPGNEADFNRHIERQLILRIFEGDERGQVGERVLGVLKHPFGGGWFGRAAFPILTGHGDRSAGARSMGPKAKGRQKKSSRKVCDFPLLQVALDGEVRGLSLHIEFFPEGPVVSSVKGETGAPSAPLDAAEASDMEQVSAGESPRRGNGLLSYECFDFPVFELAGLTRQLPAAQSTLLTASVAGLMSRGAGINGQVVEAGRLARWGAQLETALPGLKLTQPLLYNETLVVAAWCFLIAGLKGRDRHHLGTALALYGRAKDFNWHDRNVTEWAGIKANEAMAALALGQMSGDDERRGGAPENADLYRRVIDCAVEGMRHFRRDNFPASWGKLMCKVALANGALSGGRRGVVVSSEGHKSDEGFSEGGAQVCVKGDAPAAKDAAGANDRERQFASPQDYRAIANGLDQAIAFWADIGDRGSIAEAHFAKGWLAQNTARRHMGLQNWERAENAYLAALAHSSDDDFWATRRRGDIRFELGRLYLGWGTRFGEKLLVEKSIHHLSALGEDGAQRVRADKLDPARRGEAAFLLAQAHLNYGGITNDRDKHERAVQCLIKLRDAHGNGSRRQEIDRALCVARARLALVNRERGEARQAISLISAVIGQNGGFWPSRDVLLRLRARLRELLFLLEGDDLALDRAINDRRELVANAAAGPRGLRWSVEVGDLVGLLSRRQYKLDGEAQDFHEAHYLLEKSISICAGGGPDEGGVDEPGAGYNIPHIEAGLQLKLGKLLASFARVKFDLSALNEAVTAFERFLALTPRASSPLGRAAVLNDIGQIMMDRSEHYGNHDGLRRAVLCFAEAHDIYLEAQHMDQANRMRRFLENAEAAILAYQVPATTPLRSDPVEG